MKNIIKAFSLLSIMAVIPGAMAATSRVSMITRASPRLPSIAAYIASNSANKTVINGGNTAYLADIDCVNNYTDCIKGADACGSEFEECTTNVLLHAKMPVCLSVLSQCSDRAIESLFGTSSLAAITTPTKNDYGDITGYAYPSAGSALEQMVTGAQIENTFAKDECVRKYTNCLVRDTVCGEDFELCTSNTEFKKQAIACDSTLQRCQSDGKTELFGSVTGANALKPETDSRIAGMIKNGQELAAINAVKTCQRVTDNCLISACLANPWRCVEGTSMKKINAADFIGANTNTDTAKTAAIGYVPKTDKDGNIITDTPVAGTLSSDFDLYALTGSDVRKLLKAQCLDTIGANKYCHMTYREKSPKNKDLMDVDLMEDVFSLAYAARKDAINTKIQEELKIFDTNAKNACVNTITSCAMRSCGGGVGSSCYVAAQTENGVVINGAPYNDIKSGCTAIVNTDPNCQYAATANDAAGYSYEYNQDVFTKLFPTATSNSDPLGAIASLNSLLATSYNAAAIENLEKQCRNTALSCVKSMCGKDYENCYRNRTDIISGTYDTNTALDKSMNKMGGILDYNIVIGLCMNTITNASACEEHLKIMANGVANDINNAWTSSVTTTKNFKEFTTGKYKGLRISALPTTTTTINRYSSVQDAWGSANTVGATVTEYEVQDDCYSTTEIAGIDPVCSQRGTDACDTIDEDGCVYDQPNMVPMSDFTLSESAKSLFQKLLVNVEKEVQAKYNAKLTKEQNMCNSSNAGGIKGANNNGSTFMWVKLNSNKVPKNYAMKGLSTKQYKETGDLYGGFCRARITVTSDDKDIQNVLGDAATAYFAVGDSFTCGSWIDDKVMAKISEKVGERKLCEEGYGSWNTKTGKCEGLSQKEKMAYAWGTVAPALGALGVGLGLSESGLLGGWINSANQKNTDQTTQKQEKQKCISYANEAISAAGSESRKTAAKAILETASKKCKQVVSTNDTSDCNIVDVNDIVSSAALIRTACENASDTKTGTTSMAARVTVPIMSSLTAGALGAGITASVLKAKREEIKNEALKEWMEEIGEHIQCYLGADELGSYGDTIAIEIE